MEFIGTRHRTSSPFPTECLSMFGLVKSRKAVQRCILKAYHEAYIYIYGPLEFTICIIHFRIKVLHIEFDASLLLAKTILGKKTWVVTLGMPPIGWDGNGNPPPPLLEGTNYFILIIDINIYTYLDPLCTKNVFNNVFNRYFDKQTRKL